MRAPSTCAKLGGWDVVERKETARLQHNSWGATWGDGGYAWVSEGTLNTHGLDAFVVEVQLGAGGPGLPPAAGFPLPAGFPSIPGLGIPAPQGSPGGAPPTCAAGQARDLMTGACSALCSNGRPPAAGACLPF